MTKINKSRNSSISFKFQHIPSKYIFLFFLYGHAPRDVEVPKPGIKPAPQQRQCHVLNPLSHQGAPHVYFLRNNWKKSTWPKKPRWINSTWETTCTILCLTVFHDFQGRRKMCLTMRNVAGGWTRVWHVAIYCQKATADPKQSFSGREGRSHRHWDKWKAGCWWNPT